MEMLNYQADIDLAKFQSELGEFVNMGPYKLAGGVSGKGQVANQKDKLIADGTFNIKDFMMKSIKGDSVSEPAMDVAFALNLDQKSKVLSVNSANVGASFGQVNIKNAVLPLDKQSGKEMNLPVSIKLDLASFSLTG